MHLGLELHKSIYICLLVGILLVPLKGIASSEEIRDTDLVQREPAFERKFDAAGRPLVEVEPDFVIPSDVSATDFLVPYRSRRSDWGAVVGLGYSLFWPVNYEANFLLIPFEDAYDDTSPGMLELQIFYKRNFSFGSFGIEAAVGTFNAESGADNPDYAVEFTPIRFGFKYVLDVLMLEPYIVPYASGGMHIVYYREENTALTVNFGGNTLAAPYFTVGAMFQLDWFDRRSAFESYLEGGIENTFFYVEAQKFMASDEPQDPDFETDLFASAGFAVEF